MPENQIPEPTS